MTRATCCATFALLLLAPAAPADGDVQLTASAPTVLMHPAINDSIGNPVHCLAFVDAGATLATGATSGVFVWDVATRAKRQVLNVDERSVDALAVDLRGGRLIAGGGQGVIKSWDLRTWKEYWTVGPSGRSVRGLVVAPDGKRLASVSPDGQKGEGDRDFGIQLRDLATGELLRTLPQPPPIFGTTALAFLPDGKHLLAGQDRAVCVWDVDTGEPVRTVELRGVLRSLGALAVRGDGRELATGVFEPLVRLWDTASWEQVRSWPAHDREPPPRRGVVCLAYSPDGKLLFTGGMDGTVGVWDAATGRSVLQLTAGGESARGRVTGLAVSADGGTLAASQFDGAATVWKLVRK